MSILQSIESFSIINVFSDRIDSVYELLVIKKSINSFLSCYFQINKRKTFKKLDFNDKEDKNVILWHHFLFKLTTKWQIPPINYQDSNKKFWRKNFDFSSKNHGFSPFSIHVLYEQAWFIWSQFHKCTR